MPDRSMIPARLSRILSGRYRNRLAKSRRARRALFEQFEDRRMLATIVVNSLSDVTANDNRVTLREAIEAANTNASVDGSVAGEAGADTIVFREGLAGTISLTQDELAIIESLTIQGPVADRLVISGGDASRLFIFGGAGSNDYAISGLTFADGNGDGTLNNGFGGRCAMFDPDDTLSIDSSVIRDSTATSGGGIFVNLGTLRLTASTMHDNQAASGGGGIALQNVQNAVFENVTVSGNQATTTGGGICSCGIFAGRTSSLEINQSTIANNQSPAGSCDSQPVG
ncbi:MAG: CSLREA domain-containing protein [Pirellulaceae bacterium]